MAITMVQPRVKSSKINAVNQKKVFFYTRQYKVSARNIPKILQLVRHSFWFPPLTPPNITRSGWDLK